MLSFKENVKCRIRTFKIAMCGLPILLILVCFSLFAKGITSKSKQQSPYDWSYEAYKNYQGSYYAYDLMNNIFTGDVYLKYIKTRAGSYHSNVLLIYDEEKHGLLCSGVNEQKGIYLQCFPVMTIADDINENSISSNVVTAVPNMDIILILRLKRLPEGIYIYGHPLNEQCGTDTRCDDLLSALANNKEESNAMKRYILQEALKERKAALNAAEK